MRRACASALLVTVIALAGCSGGGGGGNHDSVETETTTTSSTVLATTTSTAPPTVPTAPITIPSKGDGVSADGSGCAPPPGDTLPDGIWFGDLKAVDVGASTLSLDLNCFFTGDAANAASSADGGPSPVENDYYIRNKVKKIYVLPAVADVAVFKLPDGGGNPNPAAAGNGPAAVAAMLSEFNNSWIGWLQVAGGKVIAVQQQFVP